MSTVSFIIPASTGIVGSNTTVVGDKGSSSNTKPRIRKADFGDGYSQRLRDGINHLEKEFTVSFSPRPKEEIDDIIDFFEFMGGDLSFTLSLPNTNRVETLKVVAEEWNKNYAYDNFYTASVKLVKVNEA